MDVGNCQSHPWSGIFDCHPSPSAVSSRKLPISCYQLNISWISRSTWSGSGTGTSLLHKTMVLALAFGAGTGALVPWEFWCRGRWWENYRPAPAPVRRGLSACFSAENRGTVLRSTAPPAEPRSYNSPWVGILLLRRPLVGLSWNSRRTFGGAF